MDVLRNSGHSEETQRHSWKQHEDDSIEWNEWRSVSSVVVMRFDRNLSDLDRELHYVRFRSVLSFSFYISISTGRIITHISKQGLWR